MGLLTVDVSFPPAPSSGTTMVFATSCGSWITSAGSRTAPKGTPAASRTCAQRAIGWPAKTSSRIAVSSTTLAFCLAGSAKRGSAARSARAIAVAKPGHLSGVRTIRNQAPSSATFNIYRAADDTWFLIVLTPDKWPPFTTAIGRPELAADPRFADPAKQKANVVELTAILDEVFAAQPMAHWAQVLDAAGVPFGAVRDPAEVIRDPQLVANNIVVPLEGAGGKLTSTVSSPIEVHGVTKQPAHRAPELGEHNEEIVRDIGFNAAEIAAFADRKVIAGRRRSTAA